MSVRDYIASQKWVKAKSKRYESEPHEYIVCKAGEVTPEERQAFEKFVKMIRANGYKKRFYKMEFTYLDVDGYKYWTYGDPLETTYILNRRKLDD